jgi:hypothetical protein
MSSTGKTFFASLTTLLMIFTPALAPVARAATPKTPTEQHVVSAADLQKDIAASLAARHANEAKVAAFLSTPRARHALRRVGMNYREVQRAIPTLSQAEVASLAARADKAQQRFEAGALTNQQLTYIIIALATAIIVIIAVH